MQRYPKDCEERRIGTKAKIIAFNSFNVDHWDPKELTGNDVGIDCIVELSENDEWHNKKLECQIKGTKKPNILKNGVELSYALEVKTINYALSSHVPFIFILVDVNKKISYYLPLQQYFIDNPKLIAKLTNKSTVNVHIDIDKQINEYDFDLQKLAHKAYFKTDDSKVPIEIK